MITEEEKQRQRVQNLLMFKMYLTNEEMSDPSMWGTAFAVILVVFLVLVFFVALK